MHIVNAFETLLNITGLEKKLCTGISMSIFFVFEMTVLVFMQVSYFESSICMNQTPLLYFWLMG